MAAILRTSCCWLRESHPARETTAATSEADAWRPKGQKEITVNGSRNNNLRYTLDGGTNMDDLTNSNLDFPFPNAVQEFSAQTSNMGVEQGGLSGGALNVVTKSGTNQIHGDAFWFVRNNALNATNFFSRQQDLLKRNQFGFTMGGPFHQEQAVRLRGCSAIDNSSGARQHPRSNADGCRTARGFLRRLDISCTIRDNGQPFPNNQIPVKPFLARGAKSPLAVAVA